MIFQRPGRLVGALWLPTHPRGWSAFMFYLLLDCCDYSLYAEPTGDARSESMKKKNSNKIITQAYLVGSGEGGVRHSIKFQAPTCNQIPDTRASSLDTPNPLIGNRFPAEETSVFPLPATKKILLFHYSRDKRSITS